MESDFADIQNLRWAPIIVQQRIVGLDVRVTVIGDEMFAASTMPDVSYARDDWRLDLTTKWEAYHLEPDLAEQLHVLVRSLGLHYGCIDMRENSEGELVFLEINPSGQFLFIEVDTDQKLAEAFANLLLNPRQQ